MGISSHPAFRGPTQVALNQPRWEQLHHKRPLCYPSGPPPALGCLLSDACSTRPLAGALSEDGGESPESGGAGLQAHTRTGLPSLSTAHGLSLRGLHSAEWQGGQEEEEGSGELILRTQSGPIVSYFGLFGEKRSESAVSPFLCVTSSVPEKRAQRESTDADWGALSKSVQNWVEIG